MSPLGPLLYLSLPLQTQLLRLSCVHSCMRLILKCSPHNAGDDDDDDVVVVDDTSTAADGLPPHWLPRPERSPVRDRYAHSEPPGRIVRRVTDPVTEPVDRAEHERRAHFTAPPTRPAAAQPTTTTRPAGPDRPHSSPATPRPTHQHADSPSLSASCPSPSPAAPSPRPPPNPASTAAPVPSVGSALDARIRADRAALAGQPFALCNERTVRFCVDEQHYERLALGIHHDGAPATGWCADDDVAGVGRDL